jgi:ribonuclease BN (tRNA processing enzyme)
MATDAGVGRLLLSHLSRIAPRDASNPDGDPPGFAETLSFVRSNFDGRLLIAEDLMCIPVVGSGR